MVQYDPKTKKPYVEIAIGAQEFQRKEISLGVSDGLFVEVLEGVTQQDNIKVWNQLKPAGGRKAW